MMAQPIEITSLDDPRVEVYRNVRDADLRGREGVFMAESELVVRRLLRTPERLHSLFLSPNKYERLRDAIEEAQRPDDASPLTFPIYLADVSLMSEIAGFLIHRGALACGYRLPLDELKLDRALGRLREQPRLTLLLAEGITNVDNMGGLFRNAAAFGVDGIVLDPTCCDPLYRKAIRVSVGHTLALPYAVSDDWLRDLATLRDEWEVPLLGAESSEGLDRGERPRPTWEIQQPDRVGLIFGSEAHGLDHRTRRMCDSVLEIPMACGVPSLNVATAAAVTLYERLRQRSSVDRPRSGPVRADN